jgi:hypothetical protein
MTEGFSSGSGDIRSAGLSGASGSAGAVISPTIGFNIDEGTWAQLGERGVLIENSIGVGVRGAELERQNPIVELHTPAEAEATRVHQHTTE